MESQIQFPEYIKLNQQIKGLLKENKSPNQIINSFLSNESYSKTSIILWLYVNKIYKMMITMGHKEDINILKLTELAQFNFPGFFQNLSEAQSLERYKLQETVKQKMCKERQITEATEKESNQLSSMINFLIKIKNLKKKLSEQDKAQFSRYIQQILQFQQPKDVFEELTKNWIKSEFQRLRGSDKCCSLIYFQNDKIEDKQYVQQLKDYVLPSTNQKLISHLKKTVISFLNKKGGILYNGVNKNVIKGKYLSIQKIQQIVTFLQQNVFESILPKEFHYKTNKKQQEIKKDIITQDINKYVRVEFIKIVYPGNIQNKSFLYCRNEKGEFNYLMKIYVKVGHPKHTYHLLNKPFNTFIIYERNQSNTVQKEQGDLPELLQKIQKKALKYEEGENSDQSQTFHENCLFRVKSSSSQEEELIEYRAEQE